MIKANELRIGNALFWNKGKNIVFVSAITKNSFEVESDDILPSPEDCDAVPLTPELLERCGFEKGTDSELYFIQVGNTLYLELLDTGEVSLTPETWRGDSGVWAWQNVKHLHQLQNLFFALTGEELTIK